MTDSFVPMTKSFLKGLYEFHKREQEALLRTFVQEEVICIARIVYDAALIGKNSIQYQCFINRQQERIYGKTYEEIVQEVLKRLSAYFPDSLITMQYLLPGNKESIIIDWM